MTAARDAETAEHAGTVVLQRLSIPFEYPVHFSRDFFDPASRELLEVLARNEPARRHRLLVAIDDGVARSWPGLAAHCSAYAHAHRDHLELVGEPLVVRGGERSKNDPALVTELQAALDRCGIDRQSYVVAIGGGAMLDWVGYAAATTHRGVRLVRVPTTVLSQADSGVGVKNGINAFGKKNFVGTFAPPFAVLVDTAFLATLERRDVLAGMSEAVKVALIRDAGFFSWLEQHASDLARAEMPLVDQLVRRCAELHLRHIATSGDPFEMGSARPLDFGHWAAHRLEALTDYELRHGEAVAIGIALDTIYSARIGLCSEAVVDRVLALFSRLGLGLWHPALESTGDAGELLLLAGLREFREHLGGELTVTLLRGVGSGVEVHEMNAAEIVASLEELRRRA